jgi:hypothetical protein
VRTASRGWCSAVSSRAAAVGRAGSSGQRQLSGRGPQPGSARKSRPAKHTRVGDLSPTTAIRSRVGQEVTVSQAHTSGRPQPNDRDPQPGRPGNRGRPCMHEWATPAQRSRSAVARLDRVGWGAAVGQARTRGQRRLSGCGPAAGSAGESWFAETGVTAEPLRERGHLSNRPPGSAERRAGSAEQGVV